MFSFRLPLFILPPPLFPFISTDYDTRVTFLFFRHISVLFPFTSHFSFSPLLFDRTTGPLCIPGHRFVPSFPHLHLEPPPLLNSFLKSDCIFLISLSTDWFFLTRSCSFSPFSLVTVNDALFTSFCSGLCEATLLSFFFLPRLPFEPWSHAHGSRLSLCNFFSAFHLGAAVPPVSFYAILHPCSPSWMCPRRYCADCSF